MKPSGPFQGPREVQAPQPGGLQGRVREGPGRRYLAWSLGLSFLVSNLDAFVMIYTQLWALITSQAGYLWLVASGPIESGKLRLGGGVVCPGVLRLHLSRLLLPWTGKTRPGRCGRGGLSQKLQVAQVSGCVAFSLHRSLS